MKDFLQKRARCLALLAAAVTAGTAGAAAELGAIPQDMIEGFAEDEQIESWEPNDRRSLMRLLAADERVGVRMSLVKHVARFHLPVTGEDEDWMKRLAADPSTEVREAFSREFSELLERASALDRTYLVASWAVSPSEPVRLSIARALSSVDDALGARAAIEHLCDDPVPEVRSAAREAAKRHLLT